MHMQNDSNTILRTKPAWQTFRWHETLDVTRQCGKMHRVCTVQVPLIEFLAELAVCVKCGLFRGTWIWPKSWSVTDIYLLMWTIAVLNHIFLRVIAPASHFFSKVNLQHVQAQELSVRPSYETGILPYRDEAILLLVDFTSVFTWRYSPNDFASVEQFCTCQTNKLL